MIQYRYRVIAITLLIILSVFSFVGADRLPNVSKTNNLQVPSTSNIQLVGMIDAHTEVEIDSTSHGIHEGGFLYQGEAVSNVVYKNDLTTNGGYLSQAKHQTFDEGPQKEGTYNIDSAIVSTYATDPEKGSKMAASEKLTLDTSGNWTLTNESIHNTLVASIVDKYIGGFNSNYGASSDVQLTSGQLTTKAKARSTAYDDTVPAAIGFELGIHPDMSTGLPYAEGSAATAFSVKNQEGYSNTTNFSSTKEFADATKVNGLIFNFGKSFEAKSGVHL
ncbi:MAG TPA: hypothetical protein VN372_00470 [Methanospirillum sp.]|nr:hypothetical protein [Methanospirillum sp.]